MNPPMPHPNHPRRPIRYVHLKTVSRTLSAVVVASILTLGVAVPIYAQSLAAVAQKEEDRRKNIKDPAKVYTNKDLGPALPGSVSSATPAAASEAADTGGDKDAAGKDAKDAKDSKEGDTGKEKGQPYWRDRMSALQTQADRDQTYLDAVQTRVSALTTDFVNRDDPAQKASIERERQRNLAELERLKKAVVDDKKAIADLGEEARRAGVPPGWLR
jgi:hypothetical protein